MEIQLLSGGSSPSSPRIWIMRESPRETWIMGKPGSSLSRSDAPRLNPLHFAAMVGWRCGLDVPAVPTIVLERPAPCADANRAEELLKRALAPALAPRGAWTVTARFSRSGGSISVEGEITDEVDAPVAHRVITEPGSECSSLARAVGVWAALVLDAEVDKAEQAAAEPPPPPPPPPVNPPPQEKPAPEHPLPLTTSANDRSLELGATILIMDGEGSGVLAGPALLVIAEVGRGWFLRPSVFVGRSLQTLSEDVYATLVGARVDACGRIHGFYIDRHGIQLDLCGGAEIGFQHFDAPSTYMSSPTPGLPTLPLLALGPSASLRGELGAGLALVLRGTVELNILEDGFAYQQAASTGAVEVVTASPPPQGAVTVYPSLVAGRGELGLTWQLR